MTKIVLVLILVALAQIASALNCYECIPPPCRKSVPELVIKGCGQSNKDGHDAACVRYIYVDKTTNKPEIARSCVPTKVTTEIYEKNCNSSLGTLIECKICNTDLCNSGAKLNFGIVAVFCIIMLAYLL